MKRILFILGILMLCLTFTIPVFAEGEENTGEELPAPVEPVEDENAVWEDFLQRFFSAEKVAMYMSWLAYIGTIIGLVANINKLKKQNNLTLKNVSEMISEVVKEVSAKEIKEQTERFLPNVINTQEKTNEVLKVFSKILALGQENTPESRVAILDCIEEMGTIGRDITDSAKEVIVEEVKAIEEKKESIETKLNDIIEKYDGTSI